MILVWSLSTEVAGLQSIPNPAQNIRTVHHHHRSYLHLTGHPPRQEPATTRTGLAARLTMGRWSRGAYDDMEAKGAAEAGAEPAAKRPPPRAFTLPRATAGVAGR